VTAQGKVSVERMCEIAQVSRAGFYREWRAREPTPAAMALRSAVQQAALRYRSYGYRRVMRLLRREGWAVGETVVRRIRRSDNLLAVRQRKFVATTDSRHTYTVHPNLAQYTVLSAINQLWVADITYVRLDREFVYFAVVLDAYSRRVVGWALSRRLQTPLPLAALRQALTKRRPPSGLIHHSDRGSQYASDAYVKELESAQAVLSMSRPGRPWENARCESFLHTLKSEQINCVRYRDLGELTGQIEQFIEEFYNRQRLHSALQYRSPVEFEKQARADQKQRSAPAALSFPRHREIYPDAPRAKLNGRPGKPGRPYSSG
jgi:putative transposase